MYNHRRPHEVLDSKTPAEKRAENLGIAIHQAALGGRNQQSISIAAPVDSQGERDGGSDMRSDDMNNERH